MEIQNTPNIDPPRLQKAKIQEESHRIWQNESIISINEINKEIGECKAKSPSSINEFYLA